ncbi:hypothetical protein [Pseudomonas frederiksbergensis]|uniref:hypothetical protein n=1 Tax=Pseudomonas frederiksbergensis TaxID=104087 RepID=UPI001C8374B6|nr:hypothetical protein [Pseudomonas frederiksbergensis]
MSINIDQLSAVELVALNHHIIERLKMLESLEVHKSMMQFHPGCAGKLRLPQQWAPVWNHYEVQPQEPHRGQR